MLYLVEMEFDVSLVPTSPGEAAAFGERFLLPGLETAARLVQEGSFVAGGMHAGGHDLAAIIEAPSNEELSRIIQSMAWWRLANIKVAPLESFENRLQSMRGQVESDGKR
jgi:muconolactone delta-isomerase